MSQPTHKEIGSISTINEGLQGAFTSSGRRGRVLFESYLKRECEKQRLELIAAKAATGAKPPKADI